MMGQSMIRKTFYALGWLVVIGGGGLLAVTPAQAGA
jgi:hypothetical protein